MQMMFFSPPSDVIKRKPKRDKQKRAGKIAVEIINPLRK